MTTTDEDPPRLRSHGGYRRRSSLQQSYERQTKAFHDPGIPDERTFEEAMSGKLSGSTTARPQLQACLAYLNPGDVLTVSFTDRLGRSIGDLIHVVGRLRE